MKSKQTMYFTTLNDIKPLIEEIEALSNLKYYKMGMFDDKNPNEYSSLLNVPDAGVTNKINWMFIDDYIILASNSMLNIRDVPQRKGGIKFAIDQSNNAKSITIKLGGIHVDVPNVLIAGRIGTISEEEFSLNLYKLFATKIKKRFKKQIGLFYVGPEAQQLLKEGWRLVTDIRDAKESDFKFEHLK